MKHGGHGRTSTHEVQLITASIWVTLVSVEVMKPGTQDPRLGAEGWGVFTWTVREEGDEARRAFQGEENLQL